MPYKRAEALPSVESDQKQDTVVDSDFGVSPDESEPMEATDDEKELVFNHAREQKLMTLAGLVTMENGLSAPKVSELKLNDSDKELVTAAINVLAEVIERKITTESTKRYLSLLLVFIRAALAV